VAARHAPSEAEIIEEASLALLELNLTALAELRSVSVLQVRALTVIRRHGPLNLSGVAERLEQSIPSASRLMDRLVEADLIRREMAPHSRREIVIALSPKGRRTLNRLRHRRQVAMGPVLARMSSPDRDALGLGLAAFAHAMEEIALNWD
jgi:DNA-binding MarR family transcriptional regulator